MVRHILFAFISHAIAFCSSHFRVNTDNRYREAVLKLVYENLVIDRSRFQWKGHINCSIAHQGELLSRNIVVDNTRSSRVSAVAVSMSEFSAMMPSEWMKRVRMASTQ